MGSHHAFVPHTGEVRLRLEAQTLAELFVEAGRALAELMLGTTEPDTAKDFEPVRVHASDREALLVEWLNELIFRSEVEKRVFTEFRITTVTDGELAATIGGVEVEALRTQPKAATLHELSICEARQGYTASVVIDV